MTTETPKSAMLMDRDEYRAARRLAAAGKLPPPVKPSADPPPADPPTADDAGTNNTSSALTTPPPPNEPFGANSVMELNPRDYAAAKRALLASAA